MHQLIFAIDQRIAQTYSGVVNSKDCIVAVFRVFTPVDDGIMNPGFIGDLQRIKTFVHIIGHETLPVIVEVFSGSSPGIEFDQCLNFRHRLHDVDQFGIDRVELAIHHFKGILDIRERGRDRIFEDAQHLQE